MRRLLIALSVAALLVLSVGGTIGQSQPASTQIQIAIGKLTTGVTTFSLLRLNSGSYINWGTGTAATGYGIRDNAGTLQWKNIGGDWENLGTGGGGGGAPSDASYWVRVATGGLSNESALGTLGTGLVKNTTVTGVPSIAVAADIIALWTGTCNGGTVLSGAGTCIGTSGGAPSTSSYITQVPDAGLSAEQALSLLTTGLMKVTTATGVVSTAVVGDVIGLWTGTCNSSTVLAGDGTCVANSGAPTTATYITQTANAGLSAEQALSALATGLMKVTTTTGVVSTAVVGDVLTLFTGTCNATTVLAGNGTCVTTAGGGAPATSSFWTRVPDAGLSNETALSLLGTGIVKNTTATGVPSIALVADVLALFTGTCNASTVLAGNGTCVTPSGGGGGAPIDATYITQTTNGTLTNEQALATIATGLLKVTTTSGVLSAGSVSDILGYFTGCSATTVLLGNGACGFRATVTPTYITRTPDADLTGEQALSALTTGLMKVTTGTGVVSTAAVGDIIGLWTGSCSSTTVLTGNGTCQPLSTGFDIMTTGLNVQAAMQVGTGASLSPTGSGTVTANVLSSGITIPSPVVTGLLDLVATGVRFTAADGVLTLLGLGNGNDENLTIDLDNATANQVNIATGTGVTQVNWSMTLKAGGYQSSDGTAGLTQTCVMPVTAVTIKNGLITAVTCP